MQNSKSKQSKRERFITILIAIILSSLACYAIGLFAILSKYLDGIRLW